MEQALAWVEASGGPPLKKKSASLYRASCGSPWLVSAGVARTEQLAAAYAAKAVGAIRRLEPSEPRAALIALTQQVLTRSK